MEMNNDIFTPDPHIPEPVDSEDIPISAPAKDETPAETPPPRRRRKADAPVLTIESGDEIETEDAREAAAWHEIHNAYRTRRILSAPLGGIEQTDSGKTIAVVDYNGFRIVIPLKEMMVAPSAASSTDSMAVRQMKLLGNMLGAEIDFVILGIDSKSRSVVASRREAMMRKRQLFYFSPDANGEYRVREGRVVQARVIAVADKSIRVEIFGVECSIMARDLAWDWMPEATPMLQEIYELIIETIQSQSPTVRLGSNIFPAELVRERMMQLNSEHIRFVLDSFHARSGNIRNPKKYLLAMLFNAPITLNSKTAIDAQAALKCSKNRQI